MLRPWQLLLGVALSLGGALSCFIAGVYFQHAHAQLLLQQLLEQDPYVYHVSPKLQDLFAFFPAHFEAHNRLGQLMKYGFPGLDDVRVYSDYVLSYDRRNRVAHWVCEHLDASKLEPPRGVAVRRNQARYHADMSVPSNFRATLADYRSSGFDRGHLAAAANHRAQQLHCNETFLLSNIAPQIGAGFNSGAWRKLELYVRELTEHFGSVYVITGPLYKPSRRHNGKWGVEYELIGANMVAVPTHFFKVIMLESRLPQGKPYMEAYVLPNAPISEQLSLRAFLCDIREIEHHAGLQFFDGLRRSQIFGSNFPSASQVFRDFD
ncbi:Tengl2 [Drosophila busckii]|uniref:Endonuclease n=1 Tax=Drosophila busckii TaxID=30019 RepID=A0A0M3QU74_DROBS|nr:endonuclease G, mitochondrial [Drosophila busckii]ALC40139.1 Tengl2 [Drosophila busckii]